MIKLINLSSDKPYQKFNEKLAEALKAGQENIDAISISSYNKDLNMVDSRLVNLKFIDNKKFIFFSNYNSPKAKAFSSNGQIAALMFWPSINTQIRFKAYIEKTSREYNQSYFKNRSIEKNALAISSIQSKTVKNYNEVLKKYKKVLKENDLTVCPEYWGGYTFTPYEIEFWEGNEFRLNKRNLYRKDNTGWNHFILEP